MSVKQAAIQALRDAGGPRQASRLVRMDTHAFSSMAGSYFLRRHEFIDGIRRLAR